VASKSGDSWPGPCCTAAFFSRVRHAWVDLRMPRPSRCQAAVCTDGIRPCALTRNAIPDCLESSIAALAAETAINLKRRRCAAFTRAMPDPQAALAGAVPGRFATQRACPMKQLDIPRLRVSYYLRHSPFYRSGVSRTAVSGVRMSAGPASGVANVGPRRGHREGRQGVDQNKIRLVGGTGGPDFQPSLVTARSKSGSSLVITSCGVFSRHTLRSRAPVGKLNRDDNRAGPVTAATLSRDGARVLARDPKYACRLGGRDVAFQTTAIPPLPKMKSGTTLDAHDRLAS